MRLFLETETDISDLDGFDPQQTARDVSEEVLSLLDCPYDAQVNLLLTDGEQIRQMNRSYRGIDRVTDVLSFPMIDWERPCDWDEEALDAQGAFYPQTDELILGDIVICVPRVIEQAALYGHSIRREYAFLTAHSMLHLLGYDHMTPQEASRMETLQTQVLDRLGITRELPD